MRVLILCLLATTACRSDDKQNEPSGEDTSWWQELDGGDDDEEGDTDKPDDSGKPDYEDDTGKPSTGDKVECGDEVAAGAACEGDWTTTLCTDAAGELWWCEDGTWTSDK